MGLSEKILLKQKSSLTLYQHGLDPCRFLTLGKLLETNTTVPCLFIGMNIYSACSDVSARGSLWGRSCLSLAPGEVSVIVVELRTSMSMPLQSYLHISASSSQSVKRLLLECIKSLGRVFVLIPHMHVLGNLDDPVNKPLHTFASLQSRRSACTSKLPKFWQRYFCPLLSFL